jgi:predicted outer membrane repeat protein
VITNSAFSGNSATYGGAVFTTEATTNLVNDTISGNSSASYGGGIFASSGIVGLYNVTTAANVANADKNGSAGGGGIYNLGASVTLNNSIISGNFYYSGLFVVLADCSGTLASSGNNIVTHASCTINGPYSAVAANLGPLQDNGGPNLTHALLSGSPEQVRRALELIPEGPRLVRLLADAREVTGGGLRPGIRARGFGLPTASAGHVTRRRRVPQPPAAAIPMTCR